MHLSRLVRDNADSMEYAGRIVDYDDGRQQVIPRQDCELGREYRLGRGRDWLDAEGGRLEPHEGGPAALNGQIAVRIGRGRGFVPRARRNRLVGRPLS